MGGRVVSRPSAFAQAEVEVRHPVSRRIDSQGVLLATIPVCCRMRQGIGPPWTLRPLIVIYRLFSHPSEHQGVIFILHFLIGWLLATVFAIVVSSLHH
jgi:hypothetical protein